MNREILFRGKRKYVDEFINGSLFIDSEENHYIIKKEIVDNNDDTLERLDVWSVIPETVGQYTGIKDSEGNKIFEGDIVDDKKHKIKGIVGYCSPCFCVQEKPTNRYFNLGLGEIYPENSKLENTVVIGNIHDNPELIKGE